MYDGHLRLFQALGVVDQTMYYDANILLANQVVLVEV